VNENNSHTKERTIMITRLHLQNFKSFQDATLEPGPFSLLVGANASGKSNLRDAFRFLHGIGRGYTLTEIIGEKRIEGEKVWGGIRGGLRGLAFQGTETFVVEVSFSQPTNQPAQAPLDTQIRYRIEVAPGDNGMAPSIVAEQLWVEHEAIFTHQGGRQPLLPACLTTMDTSHPHYAIIERFLHTNGLSAMRFLDPEPEAMRQPSFPGHTSLSDRGENLSSVLHTITSDPQQKETFVEWLHEFTPIDASDVAFSSDQAGRLLLTLVEGSGQRTTAYSASDGTLRFLAILAALLSPQPSRFHFFEELEAGLHPTRLSLLLNLIEQQVRQNDMQVVATTHSPQLLLLVDATTLEHISLTYRLEDHPDTRIRKLLDLPNIRTLIETQDLGRLHDSGWLEDAAAFLDETEATAPPAPGEDPL
jgi:predicted ATPase